MLLPSPGTLVTSQWTYCLPFRKLMPSSRIMTVYSSPGPASHPTSGLSSIWPVSMVSPTPGLNLPHLTHSTVEH